MITNNKILFRFIVLLFTLLTIPFPFNVIPGFGFVVSGVSFLFDGIIPWVADMAFSKSVSNDPTGSGDRMYDYILLFLFLVIAILGTFLWSYFSKRQSDYRKLNYWFLVLQRYYLGWFMMSYGIVKIIQLQFSDPSFGRLLQPLGELSPMGLAWTFMGYSEGYNMFMGLAECLGGLLLFHRRTALLGALLCVGVLTNVVAINFFFDIPVKLFSSRLLLIAVLILIPNFKRLFDLIILNRPTVPAIAFDLNLSNKLNQFKMIMKWMLVAYLLYSPVASALDRDKKHGLNVPDPQLYGLYEVANFIVDGDTLTPLLTDKKRWRYISIEKDKSIQIYHMDMSIKSYTSEVDTINQVLKLQQRQYPYMPSYLNYKRADYTMDLTGDFQMDSIICTTRRLDKESFMLTSRGFHWISERPYNR